MTGSVPPPGPLSYQGQVVVPFINETFNPTTSNNTFSVPTMWINTSASSAYVLCSKASGVAQWIPIGGGAVAVETLTGDTGGAVPPSAGNITVYANNSGNLCGSTVLIAGNPATNTLTLNVSGANANMMIGGGAGNPTLSGASCTGVGVVALASLTSGSSNTAVGASSLSNVTSGSNNLGIGLNAGSHITTGINNVCVGVNTLGNATLSSNNIIIGSASGGSFTTNESSNIIIGNSGTLGDNNAIRIGTPGAGGGTQNTCYVAGIVGNTVANPQFVQINSSTGQLGVVNASGTGFISITQQVFTTSGTYTPTTNMQYCIVECIGGGAAGGGAPSTTAGQWASGAGGGGGEYSVGVFSAATVGASQTVTIGAAGTGNSGTTGGNGGNSSLGALISAHGGSGGTSSTAGNALQSALGGAGGAGGAGGSYRCNGVPGGAGYAITTFQLGGLGSSSQLGAGGSFGVINSGGGNGVAASGYGAGGGGAANSSSQSAVTGGNGAPGIIIITEYVA